MKYKEPNGWVEKAFKDIAPLQRGFDLPNAKIVEGKYPVVFSNGVGAYHNEYKVKAPGVVTGRSGTIGTVTFINRNFWPHNTTLWVTDFKGNNAKFIYYLYNYIDLLKFRTGSGVPTLNRNDVHLYKISIPVDKEEQAKIANALSDIDGLISLLTKLIDKKKNIKQGATQQLLTGKKRLSGFCGEWKQKTIAEVADISTGNRNTQDMVSDGVYPFFVRSQHIEHINSYSFDGEAILTAGDGVGVGKVFHYINGKFDFHQRVYKISNFKGINGRFFYEYFKNNFLLEVMKYTAKSSVDSVRMEMIAGMLIPVPPTLEEQTAIAQILSDMDTEIEKLNIKLNKYKDIKQGMMQELLTGKRRLI
ncbi:restriction endonuclease subunit S [Clostridium beijerinckii]|uniref:restriction endonuclease subunit S n=1 Tax=Clostridium beijerinckii TaxID=1520 RepID=UPI00242E7E06|nr:restriction endonuclease subunit S [Clostridium beijerinckii]MDG5854391.1 restriction endonuclease subunit S [Clostridium beijerinckii]